MVGVMDTKKEECREIISRNGQFPFDRIFFNDVPRSRCQVGIPTGSATIDCLSKKVQEDKS